MLIERNQVIVGLVSALLVVLGTFFAVSMSSGLFVSGYPATAEFTNAKGLKKGDQVLVAGVRAGQVTGVRIAGGRVEVSFKTSAELPRDSRARIMNKNMLGARALGLEAGADWDHLLQDEEEPNIPLDRTSVLVDVPELGDATVDLLQDSDTEALKQLITSLADITDGQHDELSRLLDGLQGVSGVVSDKRQQLVDFIDRSQTVVNALADRDQDIVRIIDAFGSTLHQLAARREKLGELIDATAGASGVTADLVSSHRGEIDRTLNEVDQVLTILNRHQVDIAHAVAYGGVAFKGFSEVAKSGEADNPFWGNIMTTGVGQGGIDAFAGCGGLVDTMLDTIFGPAPCPAKDTDSRSGGTGTSAGAATPTGMPTGSVATFFDGALPGGWR